MSLNGLEDHSQKLIGTQLSHMEGAGQVLNNPMTTLGHENCDDGSE